MPDRIAPAELAGYELQREPSAEVAYVEAGPDALVEPGEVYLVKDGLNVQASVQIAPFKRALLDAGRDRELRDSVLAAVGGGLTLRRLGDVTYRIQESGSRTVLVYLPPDTTYMMLLVARPSFGDAESLLGALVNYQRGRTETTDGIVAELPNPLRGIAP